MTASNAPVTTEEKPKVFSDIESFNAELQSRPAKWNGRTIQQEERPWEIEEEIWTIYLLVSANRSLFANMTTSEPLRGTITAINELSSIDPEVSQRTMASWMYIHVFPTNILIPTLSKETLLEMAPYLETLNLVEEHDEEFVGELFSRCHLLRILIVQECNITGEAFDRLSRPLHLRVFNVNRCPNLLHISTSMNNLEQLNVSKCPSFNGAFPDPLDSLEYFRISRCDIFNQALPDSNKIDHMLEFIVDFCPKFNHEDHPENRCHKKLYWSKYLPVKDK